MRCPRELFLTVFGSLKEAEFDEKHHRSMPPVDVVAVVTVLHDMLHPVERLVETERLAETHAETHAVGMTTGSYAVVGTFDIAAGSLPRHMPLQRAVASAIDREAAEILCGQ